MYKAWSYIFVILHHVFGANNEVTLLSNKIKFWNVKQIFLK